MVYRHFFGQFEIISPLLSGRLPYRYAVCRSVAVKFQFADDHSGVHEIWSVDCQETGKSLKLLHPDAKYLPRRKIPVCQKHSPILRKGAYFQGEGRAGEGSRRERKGTGGERRKGREKGKGSYWYFFFPTSSLEMKLHHYLLLTVVHFVCVCGNVCR